MLGTLMSHERLFHQDGLLPQGPGWIFVFGSNLAGRHGAGAALVARQRFGAQLGASEGLTGRAYAIPTKGHRLEVLPLEQIHAAVDRFVAFAKERPCERFFVTRVGCVLAGYRDEEVASMFRKAPGNCSFAENWRGILCPELEVLRPGRFSRLVS